MDDCVLLVSELIPLFLKEFEFFDVNETKIKEAVVVNKSNTLLVRLHWFYHI